MILVKTVVDKSTIQGLGLMAFEPIKKGTVVFKFIKGIDQIFDKEEIKDKLQDPIFKFFFENYGYELYPGKIYVDLDHGRYTNHSDTPNLDTFHTNEFDVYSVANRDIAIGEEITMNYLEIENDLNLL